MPLVAATSNAVSSTHELPQIPIPFLIFGLFGTSTFQRFSFRSNTYTEYCRAYVDIRSTLLYIRRSTADGSHPPCTEEEAAPGVGMLGGERA